MPEQSIDRIFAQHADSEICSSWAHALYDIMEHQGEHIVEEWPDSWKIAWVITAYLGLWEGEGIGALWEANEDHVEMFATSLKKVGAESSAAFVMRSLDAAAKVKSNEKSEPDLRKLAEEWDECLSFHTFGIAERLAAYLRAHRQDAEPLIGEMIKRLEGAC